MAVHVAPEAAVGGPLGKLRTGDPVVLDVGQRTLAVDLPDSEFLGRPSFAPPRTPPRGYRKLVNDHILQADKGCDFDFMADGGPAPDLAPSSIPAGWHGGW
jgi:dihydroxyacid dehydratase/phosphogluconate dehydratase